MNFPNQNKNKFEERRRIQNIFFSSVTMDDILYSSDELQIVQEKYLYEKTKISFNPGLYSKENIWFSPDIDSINVLELSSPTKYLFKSLKDHGFQSVYINEFAECEKHDLSLRDPITNQVLMRRFLAKELVATQPRLALLTQFSSKGR